MSQLISARTQWQTGPVGVLVTKAGVRRIAGTRRYHVWFSILFFGFFVFAALLAFAFGTLSASDIVGALLFAVFFYIAGLWCFCGFVAFAALVAFFTLFGLFAGILRGLRSGSLCHGAKSGHGCSHDKCQKFLHNRL